MTEQNATTPQLPEAIAEAFKALVENPAYSGVVPMLAEKLGTHYALIRKNNRNVSDIQNAGKNDPKDTEVQDAAWERAIADGEATQEMIAAEKRYQKAVSQMMAEKDKLRAAVLADIPKFIGESLSEEAVTKLRKEVNDGKSVIADSVKACAAIAEMADQMLTLAGKPVENGIWSLMPQADSLMSARGRKAGKSESSGEGYATRLVEAFIDGQTTNRNVKRKGKEVFAAHFNYVAENLSKEFGDKEFPGNQVTAEEVERAYYDSKGAAFRVSEEMPADHTFEFTKEIEMRNGADGSVKKMPVTKSIRVVRWTKDTAGTEGEIAADESSDESQNANQESQEGANA